MGHLRAEKPGVIMTNMIINQTKIFCDRTGGVS